MTRDLTLRPADREDSAYIEDLLERNDLPTADVREQLHCLCLCENGDSPIGVGGLERHGDAGLLRSLAIEDSSRGDGYGKAVCNELLARAESRGITDIYLLTTTAAGFFEALGFEEIPREDAPAAIRETAEFSELCPDSATCMTRDLDAETA